MKQLLLLALLPIVFSACKDEEITDYRSAVVGLYTGRCNLLNNNNDVWSVIDNAAVQVVVDKNTGNTIILKGDIYDLSVPGGSHVVILNDTLAFGSGYFKGDSLIYATPDYDGDFTGFYFLRKE